MCNIRQTECQRTPFRESAFPRHWGHSGKLPSVRWGAPGLPEGLSRGLQKGQAPAGSQPALGPGAGSRPALGENPLPTTSHFCIPRRPKITTICRCQQLPVLFLQNREAGQCRTEIPPPSRFSRCEWKGEGDTIFPPFPFKLGRFFPGKVPRGSTGSDIRIHPGDALVWGTSHIRGPAPNI